VDSDDPEWTVAVPKDSIANQSGQWLYQRI